MNELKDLGIDVNTDNLVKEDSQALHASCWRIQYRLWKDLASSFQINQIIYDGLSRCNN